MRKLTSSANQNTQPAQAVAIKAPPGRVLDGFIKQARPQVIKKAAAETVTRAAQEVHKGAQRSSTLMRQAVKKPPVTNMAPIDFGTVKKTAKDQAKKVRDLRQHRATTIKRSPVISKFGPFTKEADKVSQTAIPLNHQSHTSEASAQPKHTLHPVAPSQIVSASHHQLERLLDHALHKADAHKKALNGRLHTRSGWRRILNTPRWLSFGSSLLAVLLLGGFFAWQNVPQVSMKLAAEKVNFNASVPDYTPPGFSFEGPIAYSNRVVSINFSSNTDDGRKFTITQEPSTETSTSLAANSLADDTEVQTSQVNGTTVYIYGDENHATWVNHGIRYTIVDNAKLNAEQLLKIADSVQ